MRIFVSAPVPKQALAILEAVGDVVMPAPGSSRLRQQEFEKRADGADAIISMLYHRVDRALSRQRWPRLKVVANVAVCYDNVDAAAALTNVAWSLLTPQVCLLTPQPTLPSPSSSR